MTKTRQVVAIGGPCDGRRIPSDLQYLEVIELVEPEEVTSYLAELPRECCETKTELRHPYFRKVFLSETGNRVVFVYKDLVFQDAINLLIDSYPDPEIAVVQKYKQTLERKDPIVSALVYELKQRLREFEATQHPPH